MPPVTPKPKQARARDPGQMGGDLESVLAFVSGSVVFPDPAGAGLNTSLSAVLYSLSQSRDVTRMIKAKRTACGGVVRVAGNAASSRKRGSGVIC